MFSSNASRKSASHHGRRKWYFKLVFILVVVTVFITCSYERHLRIYETVRYFFNLQYQIISKPLKRPIVTGWLVNSSSCQLPDYNPWDKSVVDVISIELPFSGCPREYDVEIRQQDNWIAMDTSSAAGNIECCYRNVSRADEGHSDDQYMFGSISACFQGAPKLKVADEFIHIWCFYTNNKAVIYEDFRAFIVPKIKEAKTLATAEDQQQKLNVYLVGIDSVSRLNFKRFLPKLENFVSNELDAIPMLGLTKIGRNTFPNLLAFLAGINMAQMRMFQPTKKDPYDNLSLVWKHFDRLGYHTMYSEDTPSLATFNFLMPGFFITPTDYYLRPLYRAIEDSNYVKIMKTLCINQRNQLDLQLQWLEDFMALSGGHQFSLTFSNALSHEGPLGYVRSLEPRLDTFLKWYRQSERYNSSIMFFFSDHGMRIGPIMRYELGSYEARLPFFYVILPPWYSARYPDRVRNLRANSHRLTTFFDAHATLREILRDAGAEDLPPIANAGISLFSKVPLDRTCEDAGIPPEWCTCHMRTPISTELDVVRQSAAVAVRYITTEKLQAVRDLCADLSLQAVTAAYLTREDQGETGKDYGFRTQPFREYAVQLVTVPGRAEFEATVREQDGHLSVLGISRLNLYRGQSDCLKTGHDERRFCYCRDLL